MAVAFGHLGAVEQLAVPVDPAKHLGGLGRTGQRQGQREGTLWYYDAVADALSRRLRSPLTRDLQREVAGLLELAGNP
mgnify:CR=1 FL=1